LVAVSLGGARDWIIWYEWLFGKFNAVFERKKYESSSDARLRRD
jgi:hypothetical protein